MSGRPFQPSPLGGNLGATTCSVYRLDPTGTVPLEPIPDLVPGVFSPLRVTLDVVDSESSPSTCEVTQHPVQDWLDITSHTHRTLDILNVSGLLGAQGPALPFDGPTPPALGIRLDLVRVETLKRHMFSVPLMVVTPRGSLALCLMTSCVPSWANGDGEQTGITMSFQQARIVSPVLGAAVQPDYPSQEPGNNAVSGGGQSATTTSASTATPSETPGVAPDLNFESNLTAAGL